MGGQGKGEETHALFNGRVVGEGFFVLEPSARVFDAETVQVHLVFEAAFLCADGARLCHCHGGEERHGLERGLAMARIRNLRPGG